MREAALRHAPVRVAQCGSRWSSGDGVSLDVLSPCGALLADGKNDVNENSVVTMLAYRRFRMLFTGDAGFQTEQRLLARGADLHADVLKTGHHGSAYATSPDFVAAVQPAVALVSVGRHNLFGHPAARALAALTAGGAGVSRTDLCGAITVQAEPLSVKPMLACSISDRIKPNRSSWTMILRRVEAMARAALRPAFGAGPKIEAPGGTDRR